MSNKPIELHQEDLELDEDDEIVVPYEILNPNESILPLLQHTSPSNRSRSNTLNGPPTPVSAEKSHQPHVNSNLEEDFDVLPIESFREEILSILEKNQLMILIGETGSGKTTQIPQFLLNSSYLNKQKMAVTQPRRIAAISVAKRVSEEVGCSLGEEIGYTVRFDDLTNPDTTKVKFMTDGILIRECLSDPLLRQYSIIMLDEAHERSLNTDILFGLLKNIIKQRNDLKLIITSATLDAEKFSSYFYHCPILSIPGRNYPVDIYHSKTKQIMTINGPANTSYIQSAVDVILKIHLREEEGHILVFLTGQEEIEKACLLLKQTLLQYQQDNEKQSHLLDRELIILPLYAALSNEEQIKIFQKPHLLLPHHPQTTSTTTTATNASTGSANNKLSVKIDPSSSKSIPESKEGKILRKCVIATNIAETSITVPHVRFVVDAGYVKQKVYDPSRGMESLVVVPTSKIAALQRAGRAGRTGPGQCYRLYSSECFDNMMDETIPEIQRTNLANTILYLKAIGINNVLDFDFLDPPSQDQVLQALNQLFMLKAIADNGEITVVGRKMSNFPLDPSLSRMLLESATRELHCLEDMVILCSMLCVENVFYKPKLRKSQITNKGAGQNKANLSKYGPSSSSSNNRFSGGSVGGGGEKDHFVRQLTAEEERIEIAHAGLRSEYGDFITLWNIFRQFEKFNYTYEWCERNFINFRSMKTARKIREHLQQETKKFHLYEFADQHLTSINNARGRGKEGKNKEKDKEKERDQISELGLEKRLCYAVTSGYFMNAAMQCTNDSVYKCLTLPSSSSKTANPDLRLVYISPQSAFAYTTPSEYVIYQELVFNNKLYMRNISYVNKKRLFSFINDWKPVSPLQLSGIQVTKPESAKVPSAGVKRDREEVAVKVSSDEEQAAKRGKTESVSTPSGNSNENSSAQLSAVEQAKLRYLMRKKASS